MGLRHIDPSRSGGVWILREYWILNTHNEVQQSISNRDIIFRSFIYLYWITKVLSNYIFFFTPIFLGRNDPSLSFGSHPHSVLNSGPVVRSRENHNGRPWETGDGWNDLKSNDAVHRGIKVDGRNKSEKGCSWRIFWFNWTVQCQKTW